MKYKIEISGMGGDTYTFKLTEEQYQKLDEMDIENSEVDVDTVLSEIGVEYYGDTEENVMGLYVGDDFCEHFLIEVFDESGQKVWESTNDFEFKEVKEYHQHNEGHYLMLDDFQKGTFFRFEIEDDSFDPNKFVPTVVESLYGKSILLTGLSYGEYDLERQYRDTSSKGWNFYLV